MGLQDGEGFSSHKEACVLGRGKYLGKGKEVSVFGDSCLVDQSG